MLSKKKIGYWRSNISTPKLIKNWIIQKLLGFNRRVPWPVRTAPVRSVTRPFGSKHVRPADQG